MVSNLIPLTQGGFETASTGNSLINGRECFGVKLRRPGYPDLTMLFDKETRLLSKVEFEGRFLGPDNRPVGNVTRVEYLFSHYKPIDGVKHWTKVEEWRDGRKYADIELSEIQFYNKADVSMFRVPELEAELAKFYEDRKRFDESVITFAQSIQRKDLIGAKAALQTLTSLRPDEPGNRERARTLRALEDEMLERVRANAEALFKNADYEKAQQTATEGLRIRPSDPALQALASSARRLSLIGEYIALASTKQSSGDVSGLLDTLAKLAQVLRDADPETEGSDLVRQRVPGVLAKSLTYVLDKANAKKAEALELLAKKDYPSTVQTGTEAKELFERARAVLDTVGGRIPDSREKSAHLGQEVKGLQAVITRATGFVDLASGRQALDAGYKILAGAKNESAAFYEARAHLQAADAALAKAATVRETGAGADLRKAKEGLQKVAGLITPFELDMAKSQDVSRWGKGWASVGHHDRTWLQTELAKGLLLTEPLMFPSTFVLEVDVALVNRANQAVGQSWKLYPDLITVTLVPRDSQQKPLRISLGRDDTRTGTFGDVACVNINEKVFRLRNAEKNGGQFTLSIRKDKGALQVLIDGGEITRLGLASEFARIAVIVRNGLDRSEKPFVYPAISRITLTALPPAAYKGGQVRRSAGVKGQRLDWSNLLVGSKGSPVFDAEVVRVAGKSRALIELHHGGRVQRVWYKGPTMGWVSGTRWTAADWGKAAGSELLAVTGSEGILLVVEPVQPRLPPSRELPSIPGIPGKGG